MYMYRAVAVAVVVVGRGSSSRYFKSSIEFHDVFDLHEKNSGNRH